MTTFTDRPISRLDMLYGRRHRMAVFDLDRLAREGKFTVVVGPRRAGKTSVVKTFLKHFKHDYLYFDLTPYIGRRSLSFRMLAPSEVGFDTSRLSTEAQINLAALNLASRVKMHGDFFLSNFVSLLREIDSKFDRFVLVFDEAQVLTLVKGLNVGYLLRLIHNNYENISVVLTGSMPGLLNRLLGGRRAYKVARYVERIALSRWDEREASGFLKEGFWERGIRFTSGEILEAVNELSGVPGFLSYYGMMRLRGYAHREALVEARRHAASLWRADLDAFERIYNSPLYVEVLRILARREGGASWSEIKREMALSGHPVENPTLYRLLTNLTGAGLIEKTGTHYVLVDKPLREAVLGRR